MLSVPVSALSEDALFELADYGVRGVRRDENTSAERRRHSRSRAPRRFWACSARRPRARTRTSAPALLSGGQFTALTPRSLSPDRDSSAAAAADVRLGCALSGLSMLRVLAQACESLPPAVRSRLLRAADAPAALASLLQLQPWRRSRAAGARGGARHRAFAGGAWADEPPCEAEERRPLHAAEAQGWLALLALLAAGCEAGYEAAARGRTLAAAARLLTPRLLRALPSLEWLARAAEAERRGAEGAGRSVGPEEGQGGAACHRQPGALLIAFVPPWREALLGGRAAAAAAAEAARRGCFGDGAAAARRAAEEAAAQAALWDEALAFEPPPGAARAAGGGPPPPPPPPAAAVTVAVAPAGGAAAAPLWRFALPLDDAAPERVALPAGPAGPACEGLRWRLRPPEAPRRLPPAALLSVGLAGGAAGAAELRGRLALPSAGEPAASAQEAWAAAPPWVWLTLGSLRADGWAAQLRFRRVASAADAAQHADGSLMLYRAAGGAVTRVVEVL